MAVNVELNTEPPSGFGAQARRPPCSCDTPARDDDAAVEGDGRRGACLSGEEARTAAREVAAGFSQVGATTKPFQRLSCSRKKEQARCETP